MLDTRVLLEVIRDSEGEHDTRSIDMALQFRGQRVARNIMPELRELEAAGLIREGPHPHTGPSWVLTPPGKAMLRRLGGDPDAVSEFWARRDPARDTSNSDEHPE